LEPRYVPVCTVGIVGRQLQAIGDNTATTFQLSHAGTVTMLCGKSFDDSKFDSILIDTGNGNDAVVIDQTTKAAPVTIKLGTGSDTVLLSPTDKFLDNIQGAVTVQGGKDIDVVILSDQNDRYDGDTYTIDQATVQRNNSAPINYDSVGILLLNGGS